MPRESAQVKGRRLLTEGRLLIRCVGPRGVRAWCRGDSGEMYTLGYERGEWRCSCPALGRCSHLVALMLVTVRPPINVAPPTDLVGHRVTDAERSRL